MEVYTQLAGKVGAWIGQLRGGEGAELPYKPPSAEFHKDIFISPRVCTSQIDGFSIRIFEIGGGQVYSSS